MFEAIGEGHKIMAEGPKKEIDLDALEKLAAKATPGPWEVDDCNNIRIAPKGRPIVATIHDDEDYLPRMADAQYIAAACNAVPELVKMYREADDEAADANSAWQKVRRENLALREKVRELERQRDWLVNYYAKAEAPLPCPYLEGSFDQTKPCPFWVSDSGEMPEDGTVEEWRKLLLAPVEYGDEYLDCGTSLNVCLRFAAEQAAKEAGE